MWNSQIQCGIGGGWGRSFPCADELVLPDRNVVRQLLGMVVSLVALLSVQPSLPSLNLLSNGTLPLPLLLSCLRPSTISCFVILFCFVLCRVPLPSLHAPAHPDVPDTRHLPHRGIKKTRHHPLLVQERLGPLPDSPSHRPTLPLSRWEQPSVHSHEEKKREIFWNNFFRY